MVDDLADIRISILKWRTHHLMDAEVASQEQHQKDFHDDDWEENQTGINFDDSDNMSFCYKKYAIYITFSLSRGFQSKHRALGGWLSGAVESQQAVLFTYTAVCLGWT